MYININKLKKLVTSNDHNKGAISMLEMISSREGWEDSETKYFLEFFPEVKDDINQ